MSFPIAVQNPWLESDDVRGVRRKRSRKKTTITFAILVSSLVALTIGGGVWIGLRKTPIETTPTEVTIVTTAKSVVATTTRGPKQPYDVDVCRVKQCGQSGPDFIGNRISGGRYTRKDEFPFQVAFSFPPDWLNPIWCGGSMVNDRWILTSAHCLVGENVEDIRVSVGVLQASEVAESAIEIENYWVHPSFTEGRSRKHDIALVKTIRSIKDSSKHFVSPICLPYEDIDPKDVFRAKVSGFGRTQDLLHSNKSRTASVNIVSDGLCEQLYTESPKVFDSTHMICAGDMKGQQDTCYSDTGNPLVVKNKNGSFILKGITSFGASHGLYECEPRADTPGVYTKVSRYLDWICETMANNGLD